MANGNYGEHVVTISTYNLFKNVITRKYVRSMKLLKRIQPPQLLPQYLSNLISYTHYLKHIKSYPIEQSVITYSDYEHCVLYTVCVNCTLGTYVSAVFH